jgi:hypothetical protein
VAVGTGAPREKLPEAAIPANRWLIEDKGWLIDGQNSPDIRGGNVFAVLFAEVRLVDFGVRRFGGG